MCIKSMIEHYELILEDPEGLTVNPFGFITNNASLASQDFEDCFGETDDVVGEMNTGVIERQIVNDPVVIEKRNTVQRSAIKENRRQYQDRSFSGELRTSARKSMENLQMNLEIQNEQLSRSTEEEKTEVITRKATRKSSKSYDEDVHKSMLPFVRAYSISSKPSYSKIENTVSSSEPILHSPVKENKSFDFGEDKSPITSPPLKRNNTVSQAVMSRIPKMSFHMPKRNAKSVDCKINR
eukprot:TRINITY_DN15687_c0_g1_i1.p1 TRINITY_DN15687_c0_g1~~TRINITY_DN15687_c0_g1_i1.p1  ORF type:complete len:239 (-),score=32.61 TRINITY_DN15687_c0_g1_i1:70-786(-)